MSKKHSTAYPPEMHVQPVIPGVLKLDLNLSTGDVLDRKRFAFNLWRYCHLLPILPDIGDWQEAIATAERGGK